MITITGDYLLDPFNFGIDLAIYLGPRDRYVGEADNVPKLARRIRKRREVPKRVQK